VCDCELSDEQSSTHVDHISVVLDAFIDDAFRRVAPKNQFSHCNDNDTNTMHSDQSAHSHREHNKQKLKLQARKKTSRDKSTVRYCAGCLS
jgi:hypothetical protein